MQRKQAALGLSICLLTLLGLLPQPLRADPPNSPPSNAAAAAPDTPADNSPDTTSVSEQLLLNADAASTWSSDDTSVVQLTGKVAITLDHATMSADQAVIWISPLPHAILPTQSIQIALIGNAQLNMVDDHVTRTSSQLFVTVTVRGSPQLTAANRDGRDLSDSPLYKQASDLRNSALAVATAPAPAPIGPIAPTPGGTNAAAYAQAPSSTSGQVQFHANLLHQIVVDDGTVALELSGDVVITDARDNGDFLELLAQNVVLFTSETSVDMKSTAGLSELSKKIKSAYLEGDVRIIITPGTANRSEQRLTAERAFYDLRTDHAILTNVVLHTIDPTTQVPIIVHAVALRQLAQTQFSAKDVQLTASNFATPTFDLRASYAYIHEQDLSPQRFQYNFVTRGDVIDIFGLPIFYFPGASGSINNDPSPLRGVDYGQNSRWGYAITSQWGLFETLGQPVPKDLDISFRTADYLERGFGGGLDGKYAGGFISDTDDPIGYEGDFSAFMQSDKGVDNLGAERSLVTPPTELRGDFLWEHQQFLPDNWQVQMRNGWTSDPTYLEEYHQTQYDNQTLPYDASFYAKHEQDTEAITFLTETDTTPFVTSFDRLPDQYDVARLPEIGYDREGDSFADDNLTFYSETTASALHAEVSHFNLAQQGFANPNVALTPGLPSDGFTGTTGAPVYRADSREEVDWPISLGEFRIVPYIMARATTYSTSPGGDGVTRLIAGDGLRMTTTFWRVDDDIDNQFLDIHRIRHIIQPEINLFASTSNLQNDENLYDYDPMVDGVSDIDAAQFALHQRWETQRGGEGRWRSSDLFNLNVEADLYGHQPPPNFLNPLNFRGIYFPSDPEASVPRQAINSDATWHISDTTSFIADSQWNLDQKEQAILEGGLAVSRDQNLTAFLSDSYIEALDSQVLGFAAQYRINTKYTAAFSQSLYFGESHDEVTSVSIARQFDVLSLALTVYTDEVDHNDGFTISVIPTGLGAFSKPLSFIPGQ